MTDSSELDRAALSPEQALQLDQLCAGFEAAWKAGQQPRIEDYLRDTPKPARAILLRQLLVLDLAYRGAGPNKATLEDYQTRFPMHSTLLAAFFRHPPSVGGQLTLPHSQASPNYRTLPGAGSSRQTSGHPVQFAPGYEIKDVIGQGGMGIVYQARQINLDRTVAIKVLLPGKETDRFLREARLLAKIRSPRVVTVYDCDVLADGSPMLVMEWVEGADLLQTLKKKEDRLSEEEVLPWMRQTCEGMWIAAQEGIIHRDLKPGNILIDSKGHARVADFGLARGPTSLGDLTSSGGMMGTPRYMAPEQAEDPRSVDTRADIYSFGATFYHALTGVPPFDGETPFSILYKHKTEPLISPKARNPALSDRTNEVLERCLAKSPSDRFGSFAELLQQLQPAAASSPWNVSDDAGLAQYLERYQSRRGFYLAGDRAHHQELDTYEFPRGRLLRIIAGDIVVQEVDAIVSSDNYYLTMGYGVSDAIRRAGGWCIAKEAKRFAPVRPGRVVVTSAGALPARFVFHAATVGKSEYRRPRPENETQNLEGLRAEWVLPSRDLISELLASCFYHTESLFVQTIAFSLLGTGAAGFSREVCLDTMFRFLARMLLRGLTSVHEARIIIFE